MTSSSSPVKTMTTNLSHPPVSSKAKDYSDRPTEVTDELDALRTAGIAKVLNRHFTETTKQLATEKAQADAALADLERRRSKTTKWNGSKVAGSAHLNPYDAQYMQLQKRRAECRRKEKETMLLYQRYVMKYGKSAKTAPIQASTVVEEATKTAEATETSTNDAAYSEAGAATTKGGDPPGDPPGKSLLLGSLDENSELTFSKYYQEKLEEAGEEAPPTVAATPIKAGTKKERSADETTPVKNFMSALNKFMKEPKDKDQQEGKESKEQEKKQSRSPFRSPLRRGNKNKDSKVDALPQVDPDFTSAVSKFVRKNVQGDSDTAKDGSSEHLEPTSVSTAAEEDTVPAAITSENTRLLVDAPEEDNSQVEAEEMDPEEASTSKARFVSISESPAKAPAPTAAAVDDGAFSLATPTRPLANSSNVAATVTPTVEVTTSVTETPSFATTTVDDEVELDERSIISGLTFNSVMTRQVLDDVHSEIEDFIKTETEAIRRMLDTEAQVPTQDDQGQDSNNSSYRSNLNDSSSSLVGDESVLVAAKAEAMAREMQRILEEIEKDDASSVGGRMSHISEVEEEANKDLPSGDLASVGVTTEATTPTPKYPYKFEPAIPGEEWYVYYDDKYDREFYLEKETNRTQWEEPSSVPTPRMVDPSVVTAEDFMSDMHSVASSRASRRSMSRRSSRRSLYRKKMKKRRRRRLMMSFLALFSVLVCVFHWRVNYPEKSFADAMQTSLVNLQNLDLQQTQTYLVDQFEYTFTDRRAREEAEAVERSRALEEQRRLKALREKKAREEAARKAREEAERKAAEAEGLRIQKAKQEVERKAREEEARLAAAKEATRLKEVEESRRLVQQANYARNTGRRAEAPSERRPMACNIPFAYIHPKCGRLAKKQPLFNPEELGMLE